MRKADTIVEVVVSIAIFAICMLIAGSTYVYVARVKRAEVEYMRFESMCLDINEYYTRFNQNWDKWYFGLDDREDANSIYFDLDYQVTESENATYTLSYSYAENTHELIINVIRNDGHMIISNLNYGGNRYV